MNPNRECRMCSAARLTQKPVAELKIILTHTGLDNLINYVGGCPACTLAAIRQCGPKYKIDPFLHTNGEYFDFSEATAKFWAKVNDQSWEAEQRAMGAYL